MDIYKWSENAADNDDNPPDGAKPGWFGEDVNDWGRETMASVRRWFSAPQWINPFYHITSSADPVLVRFSATVLHCTNKNLTSVLAKGDRLRVTDLSVATHEMTVLSATWDGAKTIITIESGAVPTNPDILEMFFANGLSGFTWGGIGTSAQKETAFPIANGIAERTVWYDTDDNTLEIGFGNVWVKLQADTLKGEATTSFVQTSSSGLAEAAALQTIGADLTVEGDFIGEANVSSDVKVFAPDLSVEDSGSLIRMKLTADAVGSTGALTLVDSGGTDAVVHKYGEDGSIQVKEVGGANTFSPLLGKFYQVDSATPGSGWRQLNHSTGTSTFSYPETPDGVKRFKVEVMLYCTGFKNTTVSNSPLTTVDTADYPAAAWFNGTNGSISLDRMWARGHHHEHLSVIAAGWEGPGVKWFSGTGPDDTDLSYLYMCVIVQPAASEVGTLGVFRDTAGTIRGESHVLITPLRE
jgi:hypothetical protein